MKILIIFTLTIFVWLFALPSLAQEQSATTLSTPPASQEISLKEEAIKENSDPSTKVQQSAKDKKKQESVTPVVSESLIRLDDEYAEARSRNYDLTLSLGLEQYAPTGTVDFAGVPYQTQEAGKTVLPSLSFGFRKNINETNTWSLGTKAKLAWTRQDSIFVTPAGASSDSHMDTLQVSLKPYVQYTYNKWSLAVGAEYGQYQLNQSASSSYARWSLSSTFSGSFLAAAYNFTPAWSLGLETANRSINSKKSNLQISSNSTTLQTEYQW